jgi:hypothetical protein
MCSGKHQVLKSFALFLLHCAGTAIPRRELKRENGSILSDFCRFVILARSMQYVNPRTLLKATCRKTPEVFHHLQHRLQGRTEQPGRVQGG